MFFLLLFDFLFLLKALPPVSLTSACMQSLYSLRKQIRRLRGRGGGACRLLFVSGLFLFFSRRLLVLYIDLKPPWPGPPCFVLAVAGIVKTEGR